MTDSNTSSTNVVVGKVKKSKKRLTITLSVVVLLIVIVIMLISWFVVSRSNSNKIKTSLSKAQIYNNQHLPNLALGQLGQIQGLKMNTTDQEAVLIDKLAAYTELNDYTNSLKYAEQAYNLAPANLSLLSTIAQLAQSNNDTKTAIKYYQKLVVAMGQIPAKERSFTYNADLGQIQAQIKELSNP